MACEYCDQKGYVEIEMMKDNSTKQLVRPCPQCNDTKSYYRHIKQKYGTQNKQTKKTVEKDNTKGNVVSLSDRRK